MKENPAALGLSPETRHRERGGDRDLQDRLRRSHAGPAAAATTNRKEGAAIRERLTRLGILRDTGPRALAGADRLPGDRGERRDRHGLRPGHRRRSGKHDRHLFLPGPQRGIWNPAALRSPEVIVTEGIIDALTFWCAGFRHVTTGYSAKALPEELLDALLAAKVQRVFLAFDRDEAGDKGAAEAAAQLMARGIECRRVLFPHGQDANGYALARCSPPPNPLASCLNAARLAGQGHRPLHRDAAASRSRGVVAAAPVFHASRAPSSLAAKAASG